MLSKAIIMGAVETKKLETKMSKSGNMYLSFNVVTWNKTRDPMKDTLHSVMLFGQTAEKASVELEYGDIVYIEGTFKIDPVASNIPEYASDTKVFGGKYYALKAKDKRVAEKQELGEIDDVPF